MINALKNFPSVVSVTSIISSADGKIVGRTRLQKVAYLLSAVGLEEAFDFEYKRFGPFSWELAQAVDFAQLAGVVQEQNRPATWGGTYSIYTTDELNDSDDIKKNLIQLANNIDSVVLELAATAIFLSEDHSDPWEETKKRKPSKASPERISSAKEFISELNQIAIPIKFESLVH